jgi:hypothetical protein
VIEYADIQRAITAYSLNFHLNSDWQDKRNFSNECMLDIARKGMEVFTNEIEQGKNLRTSVMFIIWWGFQLGYEMGVEFGVTDE